MWVCSVGNGGGRRHRDRQAHPPDSQRRHEGRPKIDGEASGSTNFETRFEEEG